MAMVRSLFFSTPSCLGDHVDDVIGFVLVDALKPKTRQRQIVKLPWEVTTVYADFLRHFKGTRGLQRVGEEEDSEEDEDELEANEDMLQRLKASALFLLSFSCFLT